MKKVIFELEKWIEYTTKLIEKKIKQKNKPIFVFIWWWSWSWKTSVISSIISEKFQEKTLVISMDDYFKDYNQVVNKKKVSWFINWTDYYTLRLRLMHNHLKKLSEGKQIKKPIYNFKLNKSDKYTTIKPKNIIIFEWIHVLSKIIKFKPDIKIFIDNSSSSRLLRILFRDIKRKGIHPVEILNYFFIILEPNYNNFISPTKNYANIIIKNDFNPAKEFSLENLKNLVESFS